MTDRGSKPQETQNRSGALDPVTGLGVGSNHTLVLGKSPGERESVARAVHRFHCGPDGPFLRLQCGREESLLRQGLQSWLAESPPGEQSPRLLERLEGGSLFLDEVEALGPESQELLAKFIDRSSGSAGAVEGSPRPPGQPWKGQLIVGSSRSLRALTGEGGFASALADRLEKVRIVLDPDEA
jgi:two-component system response regulator HydG